MIDGGTGVRASLRSLTVGASLLALGIADAAMAQQMCNNGQPGPVCQYDNDGSMGGIVGAPGTATIVINSGDITGGPAITQGQSTVLYVVNQAGGSIVGDGGAAILASPQLAFTVINAGTIEGDVIFSDFPAPNPPSAFTASMVRYVSDGGTLDGDLQLGSANGYGTALFVQRGATSGVTGTITAGDGIDIYAKSYDTTQSIALGQYTLPATFEAEGYEVLGEDTVLTLTGSGVSTWLLGNGHVVNNATINKVDASAAFPVGVTVVPPALSYAAPNMKIYPRQGFAPGSPQSFFAVAHGDGLASFTNNGEINGDIVLTTASFVNNGDINLVSNSLGSVIYTVADQAFLFRNAGSITLSDEGPRPPAVAVTEQFFHGTEGAIRLQTAIDSTVLTEVDIENTEEGVISGGLAFSGVASEFNFTNDGLIEIGDNPFGIDRAVSLILGGFPTAMNPAFLEDAVADSVTITNGGTIDGGIEVESITRNFSFTNTGQIYADSSDPYAEAVELGANDWPETPGGPDSNNTDIFSFDNQGLIGGSVYLEAEATLVSIINSGTIEQGVRPGHGVFVNESAADAFIVEQETTLAAELEFENTGTISNEDYGGGAVLIIVEAGRPDTGVPGSGTADGSVTFTNSGSILSSGGNYITLPGVGPVPPGEIAIQFASALAIDVDAEGDSSILITNAEGGLIDASGISHNGTPTGPADVANPPARPAGIAIAAQADEVTIVNHGTIIGGDGGLTAVAQNLQIVPRNVDFDFEGVLGGAIDTFDSIDDVTNSATGVITGGVALRQGDDTFTNLGLVTGGIWLGSGSDTLINDGTIVGDVWGGLGNDTLTNNNLVDGNVDMGAGMDWVYAFGEFTGDVLLGDGNDVFLTLLDGAATRFGGMIDGGVGFGDSFIFVVSPQYDNSIEEMAAVSMTGFEYVGLAGNGTFTSDGTARAAVYLSSGDLTFAEGAVFNAAGADAFLGGDGLVQTLTNRGTINGSVSLGTGDDTFKNYGTLNGNLDMGVGSDWVYAFGEITGDVFMGDGNDVFLTLLDGAATRFGGTIDGGAGFGDSFTFVVTEAGGSIEEMATVSMTGFEYVGLAGNGTFTSDGTARAAVYLSSGNLTFAEGAVFNATGADAFLAADGLVQNLTNRGTINGNVSLGTGDDTFKNYGTLNGNLLLGDGNDTFTQGVNAILTGTANGGNGNDTFVLDLGNGGSLTSNIYDKLINFEVLTTIGTGSVVIEGSDAAEQHSNQGVLNSDVSLGGGDDAFNNTGTVNGEIDLGTGNNTFENAPGATINGNVVAAQGNDEVTNAGEINGNVDLGDGDNTFANAPTATVNGDVAAGTGNDTVINEGTINGDVYLDGGQQAPASLGTFALRSPAAAPTGGNDTFVHSGTVTGNVDMGQGDDTLELRGAWSIGGFSFGGEGDDVLNITFAEGTSEEEPHMVDFDQFDSFETLEVAGGTGKFEGSASFEAIEIIGGRLIGAKDSHISGAVTVHNGGTFGSAGTVTGNISVGQGGTLSPGASPEVMHVIGDVSLASGSTTVFEFVPAPGQSDQLLIDGDLVIAPGAVLNMVGNRPLTPGVAYDLIVADSITGTFTIGTWDNTAIQGFLAYRQGADADRLQLLGTFVASGAISPQAEAAIDYVNSVLIAGDASTALLNAVPDLLGGNGYANAAAFAQIGPEAYASAAQLGIERGLGISKAFRSGAGVPAGAEARPFTFATTFGDWRTLKADADSGTSRAKNETWGILGGVGFGSEAASVAAFVGYLDSTQKIGALDARTDADGVSAGVMGQVSSGGFHASATIAYDWGKAETERAVPTATVESSEYRLRSLVLDASVGYELPLSNGIALRPEVGLTHISTKRGSAEESGSAAFALDVDAGRLKATFLDAGLRLLGGQEEGATFHPWAQVGVREQVGGGDALASAGFTQTSARFALPGAVRKDTVVTAGAGFALDLSPSARVFAAYQGEFGGGTGSNVSLGVEIGF